MTFTVPKRPEAWFGLSPNVTMDLSMVIGADKRGWNSHSGVKIGAKPDFVGDSTVLRLRLVRDLWAEWVRKNKVVDRQVKAARKREP